MGSASSAAALSRLELAVTELKARQVEPMLRNAVASLKRNNATAGAAFAMKALGVDERSGLGWYLLAIARDMAGDLPNALKAYETALRHGDGRAIAVETGGEGERPREHLFSAKFACPVCNYALAELEPRLFSFNNPFGACPSCDGDRKSVV